MGKSFNPQYIYSSRRRKHQRRINQFMRQINRGIEKDSLWHGRFVVRTGATSFVRYEDNSGYELVVELVFTDKRTGYTWTTIDSVNHLCSFNGNALWRLMNDFIVEYVDVWRKEGTTFLHNDTTNYSAITM